MPAATSRITNVVAKRIYGSGHLHERSGSYYGRWRTADGRQLNRKIGPIRSPGETDGLTRAQAERQFRRLQEAEERTPRPARGAGGPTVDEVADSLRQALRISGARRSYLEGCESMQRVHISPELGDLQIAELTTTRVETLATGMLTAGLAPKSIRNILSFLHSIAEHAIDRGWATENPVRRAARPGRRRQGDANPDLQFLTLDELNAVIRAIPDETVVRAPAPTRRGRGGPAPPPPPDVLGPVLRVLVLAAAMTGLRQSELLGLRWRDVDWAAQRIRAEFGEFDPDQAIAGTAPLYFTGEMIYPWMIDADPVLRPLREAAGILAERDDWPPLYDPTRLAANEVPVAAAVYYDDMYVDREFSMQTAQAIRGLRTWVTSEYEHDGLRVSNGTVLNHLIELCRGDI